MIKFPSPLPFPLSSHFVGRELRERLNCEGHSLFYESEEAVQITNLYGQLSPNVDEVVEKLKSGGIEMLGVVCHVSDAEQQKNLVAKTIQEGGPHLKMGSSVVLISVSAFDRPAAMAMYGVTKTALLVGCLPDFSFLSQKLTISKPANWSRLDIVLSI